jgi:hypothetical protein
MAGTSKVPTKRCQVVTIVDRTFEERAEGLDEEQRAGVEWGWGLVGSV